ncbi:MAG TPA: head GIN domain-containing protein [Sphingomicrobium sp.]|nr:head GIN domain-containing protein [Sphingomicrobium sp.]
MRTFLITVPLMLAIAPSAQGATRSYGITDFTKVRVEGPYKVTLVTGVPPYAKASGSSTAMDRIAVEVRGDTLVIRTDPSAWGGYPGIDPGPVEVSIGTHDLANASLIGSGNIVISRVTGLSFALAVQGSGSAQINDVAADQMNVSLAGTASARLAGRTKRLTAVVRGLSALDAAKLSTPGVHISAEGSATIDASVAQSAQVEATGPATIRFSGSPSCELHVSGSASVSGCK